MQLQIASPRQRILEQHKALRARLVALHELAFEVRTARRTTGDLKTAMGLLILVLAEHMADEEQILSGPGGWTAPRVNELSQEHVVQRRMLEDFVHDASTEFRADALSRIALELIEELLHDMRDEEADLFAVP